MGIYHCDGCQKLKDDDHSPMSDSEMCDECEAILEDWHIKYNPKPIPDRSHDWDYWHDEYDGECDPRRGTAESQHKARLAIIELENEL